MLRSLDKPALLWWSSRCAANAARDNLLSRLESRPLNDVDVSTVCDQAVGAHTKIAAEGAAIGNSAHDSIAIWASGEAWDTYLPEEPQARNCVLAMLAWMKDAEIKEPQWAGRGDLVAYQGDKLIVGDFKTNKASKSSIGIYDEAVLQVAAYALCVEAALGREVDETIVVHADREGRGYTTFSRTRAEWVEDAAVFLHLAHINRHMKGVKQDIKTRTFTKPQEREAAA